MANDEFNNYVKISIKTSKSFEPLLNQANLSSTELSGRLDIITSVMNNRPVKRINKGEAVFSLSPKEMVMPLLSRVHILQNLLHCRSQLMDTVSWTDYEQFKSDSQDLLQAHLLNFLYNESS